MNCEHIENKPLEVDPYVFQEDDNSWYERHPDGNYVVKQDLIIKLKVKPVSPKKGVSPGCAGDHFVLSEDGDLYIMKGFTFNGPDFLDDAACRMLAAMVHDALCTAEARGQYSYWQKNKFFGDICNAQGDALQLGRIKIRFGNLWFVGLLAGNWANPFYSKLLKRRTAS